MAVADLLTSRLESFRIKIGGRWATVRVEPEMMNALHEIARALNVSLHELCTEIEIDRIEGSLSSMLRVFVVSHYRHRRFGGPSLPLLSRARHSTAINRSGVDRMRRRHIAVGTRGVAPELVSLHKWWGDRRRGSGKIPLHSEIDPKVFKTLGLEGSVHVIDTSSPDPSNYQVRLWARRVALAGDCNRAGERLGEIAAKPYRSAVVEDYFSAVTMGTPQLYEVDASVGDHRRVYQRLIVPFSGGSGKPDSLLVAVCYQPDRFLSELS
jgi:predicted DNA-binding ribbon-helix-helix protein